MIHEVPSLLLAQTVAPHGEDLISIFTEQMIEIVASIGTPDFSYELTNALNNMIGVDHCTCHRLLNHSLAEIGIPGGQDKLPAQMAVHEVRRHLVSATETLRLRIIRTAGETRSGLIAEHRHETILIYVKIGPAAYCLSLSRAARKAPFRNQSQLLLERLGMFLMTAIARHSELIEQKSDLGPALNSHTEIVECIKEMSNLSNRESEVCACALCGLSSIETASELSIGKESVITYRKRAYARLEVTSQRELLLWYLDIWAQWNNSGKRTRGTVKVALTA